MGVYPDVGAGGGISAGTAAARGAAAAKTGQLYWATDTDEISYSDGAAWHAIQRTSAGALAIGPAASISVQANGNDLAIATANGGSINTNGQRAEFGGGQGIWRGTNGANEAAGATAGAGAALPATVQGYFIVRDSANNVRKIPYYAN